MTKKSRCTTTGEAAGCCAVCFVGSCSPEQHTAVLDAVAAGLTVQGQHLVAARDLLGVAVAAAHSEPILQSVQAWVITYRQTQAAKSDLAQSVLRKYYPPCIRVCALRPCCSHGVWMLECRPLVACSRQCVALCVLQEKRARRTMCR